MKLKKSIILLSFLVLIISAQQVLGQGKLPAVGASIQWQKIELEERLKKSLSDHIRPLLSPDNYSISVDVLLAPQKRLSFNPGEKYKSEKESGLNESQVKPLRDTQQAKDEGFVVFSKLGLEAPQLEYFEEKSGFNLEKQLLKDQYYFESYVKIAKSMDLFENIDDIEIKLFVDEGISSSVKEILEKHIKTFKVNYADLEPEVVLTYQEMKKNDKSLQLNDILDLVAKTSSALGLVIAALLLAVAGFLIARQYRLAQREKNQAQQAQSMTLEQKKDEEDSEAAGGAGGGGGGAGVLIDEGENAIERFEAMMDRSINDAIILLKKWIYTPVKYEPLALSVLVKELETAKLELLFSKLNRQDRESWKGLLLDSLSEMDIAKGKVYIAKEVVSQYLIPTMIDDAELCDLMIRIKPEECAKLIQDNPSYASFLLNSLNTDVVARVLEKIDDAKLEETIKNSMEFDPENVSVSQSKLKKRMLEYIDIKKAKPFLTKMKDIIPTIVGDKEIHFYQGVSSDISEEELYSLVKDYYPSTLVLALPPQFVKQTLSKFDQDSTVKYLMSLSEYEREELENMYAPVGSKARDVLVIEYERLESDIGFQKDLRDKPEVYQKTFMVFLREQIKEDQSFRTDIDNILSLWCRAIKKTGNVLEVTQNIIDGEYQVEDSTVMRDVSQIEVEID